MTIFGVQRSYVLTLKIFWVILHQVVMGELSVIWLIPLLFDIPKQCSSQKPKRTDRQKDATKRIISLLYGHKPFFKLNTGLPSYVSYDEVSHITQLICSTRVYKLPRNDMDDNYILFFLYLHIILKKNWLQILSLDLKVVYHR